MRLIKPQYKSMTDESLMMSISKGDKRAFDEIYARYSGPLLGYFMRMLWKDREKAEDFVHDIFAKIVRKPESFDVKRNFKTWLYSVANNMCKNEYRRIKTREKYLRLIEMPISNLVNNDLEKIGKAYDQELFSKRLRIELDKLSLKYSTTFILRHEHGLSIKSIAEIMNCPEGTVKSRLFFTIKQLSNRLKLFKSIKL